MRVVDWASVSVIDGVANPLVKVTEDGYVGAVPFGELAGPLKDKVFEPV